MKKDEEMIKIDSITENEISLSTKRKSKNRKKTLAIEKIWEYLTKSDVLIGSIDTFKK